MTDHIESASPAEVAGERADESQGRILLEILSVILAVQAGLWLGGLTGFLPAGAILGMALPVVLGTWLLRKRGLGWADLGLARPKSWKRLAVFTLIAIIGSIGAGTISALISGAVGFSPPDFSIIIDAVEGNLVYYLWFLIPVSWLSAGVGEEMVTRGFLLARFNDLFGRTRAGAIGAVVAQAALFAAAHFYQGPSGVIAVFVAALVFGGVFIGMRRNLWATIAAHALIDTVAITVIFLGYGAALTGQG